MDGMIKKTTACPDPVGAIPPWLPCSQPDKTNDPVFKNNACPDPVGAIPPWLPCSQPDKTHTPHFSPNTEINCATTAGRGCGDISGFQNRATTVF